MEMNYIDFKEQNFARRCFSTHGLDEYSKWKTVFNTLFKSLFIVLFAAACSPNEVQVEEHDGYTVLLQTKGPALCYSPSSGIQTINQNGLFFKDLNRHKKL